MKALHSHRECVPAIRTTSISLSTCPGHLTKVRVSAGDLLRVERGLLWYTIDGRLEDFIVKAGSTETISENLTLTVTGFGPTAFVLASSRPRPRFVRPGGVQPYRRAHAAGRLWKAAARSMIEACQSLRSRMRAAPVH